MSSWSAAWWEALWQASWSGGLALAVVWLFVRLFPRTPGSIQCWLWRLAYLKVLLALVWWRPIELPVLPPAPVRAASAPILRPRAPALKAGPARFAPAPANTGPVPAREAAWPFLLWLLGAGSSCAAVACEVRRLRSLRRSAEPLEEAALLEQAGALCDRLRLRRRPRLLVTERARTPLAVGFGRPAIILPASLLRDCSPAQVGLVVAHELTHLKRGDLAWCWLPLLARTLWFFHPLVWLAEREWQQAQELACDEQTLAHTGASIAEYGHTLLKVAALGGPPERPRFSAVGVVGSHRGLERRLQAMYQLDSRHRRSGSARCARAALVLFVLVGLAPWRITARAAQVPAEPVRADARSRALVEAARRAAERANSLQADIVSYWDHECVPRATGSLLLAKPNLAAVKLSMLYEMHRRLAYRSDGRSFYSVAVQRGEYTREEPGPSGERLSTAAHLGGPINPLGAFLSPRSLFLSGTARYVGRRRIGGRDYDVVEMQQSVSNGGQRVTELFFGPTALLERVDLRVPFLLPHPHSGSGKGKDPWRILSFSFRLKNLRLDVPADPDRFAYAPPAGFRETASLWSLRAVR